MVGGSISNKNVFAALETLKKKKKSSDKNQKGSETRETDPVQVTWVPTLLNKSWADVDDDDDDDDDYFKSVPLLPAWGFAHKQDNKEEINHFVEEDSESEDDGLIEDDYDVEDEPEQEPESSIPVEHISKNPTPAPVALKDPERQLSKKELKKKELEELDALLAEFSVPNKEENNTGPVENNAADEDGKENTSTLANIKSSKKKKVKKEKSSNEGNDAQKSTNDPNPSDEVAGAEPELKEDSVSSSEVDIKEKLKKIAHKKKKSTKDAADAPSKAAAIEAAARTAKLAAAKKKEKSHYNQQPVR